MVWMYVFDVFVMDLCFYYDGLGMEMYVQEFEGLEMIYEDFEKGWGMLVGIVCSSEIMLWVLLVMFSCECFVQMVVVVQVLLQLVVLLQCYLVVGVFGWLWSLFDCFMLVKVCIEDKFDFLFVFYQCEIEQWYWYGFWDYGDICYIYDVDCYEWCYDVGGFVWDNFEFLFDFWFWYVYLCSGWVDIFCFVEVMVCYISEVDIYYFGCFQGLGMWYNVQYWGCSFKQVCIFMLVYWCFYYYLIGDECIGDIMCELLDVDCKFEEVDFICKFFGCLFKGEYLLCIGFGIDWCLLVVNWLIEWECMGNICWCDKILCGMEGIVGMLYGFFSVMFVGYEFVGLYEGVLYNIVGNQVLVSYFNVVFGVVEILVEMIELIDLFGFECVWLQYCEFYNVLKDEQVCMLGRFYGGSLVFSVGYLWLMVYVVWKKQDLVLVWCVWCEFVGDMCFYVRLLKI